LVKFYSLVWESCAIKKKKVKFTLFLNFKSLPPPNGTEYEHAHMALYSFLHGLSNAGVKFELSCFDRKIYAFLDFAKKSLQAWFKLTSTAINRDYIISKCTFWKYHSVVKVWPQDPRSIKKTKSSNQPSKKSSIFTFFKIHIALTAIRNRIWARPYGSIYFLTWAFHCRCPNWVILFRSKKKESPDQWSMGYALHYPENLKSLPNLLYVVLNLFFLF
jgi:hypothetical protein